MNIRSLLVVMAVVVVAGSAALAEDWPQWRGPNRDQISKEKGLLQTWPKAGPKLQWTSKDIGLGYSGFAVVGDVLYTMGARGNVEYAIALSVKDGAQLWATQVGPIFLDPLMSYGDGPRATPTVDGNHVYCLGGHGELVCLKRDKGTVVWRKNLVKEFKGEVMEHIAGTSWGYCESPLVDGPNVICCPGGPDGWMMAFDKNNGNEVWRTKGLKDQATDSSIVLATIGGVKQYINTSFKGGEKGAGLVGVSTDGKVLWYAPLKDWDCYAICSTPIVHGDWVYATAGYSKGCALFKIEKDAAGKFTATESEKYNAKNKRAMQNEHGGVVLVDGHVYGYSDGSGWVCQDFETGKQIWKELRELGGKSGSVFCADGQLYLLSDEGKVALVAASPKGWQSKGNFKLPELSKTRPEGADPRATHNGIKVWTHPVVANGRLYIRDQELLFCYEVK